jgi:hypothetical protein
VKLKEVDVFVAIKRMQIWARDLNSTEKDTMAHTVLCGGTVTYLALDAEGKPVGRTRIDPENFNPVTLVTETTF